MLKELLCTEMDIFEVQMDTFDEMEVLLGEGCGALLGCGGCKVKT